MAKLEPLMVFNVQNLASGRRLIQWQGITWEAQTEAYYSGGILKSHKWLLFEGDLSNYVGVYPTIPKALAHLTKVLEPQYNAYKNWLLRHHLQASPEHFKAYRELTKTWQDLKARYGSWYQAWLAEPDAVEQLERLLA